MISLFYGVPGAGKTTAMMDFVAQHALEQVFFVVDRAGEWSVGSPDHASSPNPRWRGADIPISVVEPDSVPDEWEPGVYLFQYPWEGIEVAELARSVGNVTYVDDEIDLVAVYKGWESSPLRDFVHRGRHLPNANGDICEVHILGAARRPQSLHTDLTAMADQAMIFRVQGYRTLKRLVDDSYVEETDWDEIRTLPNFEYFLWRSNGTIVRGEVSNPFAPK